MVSNVKETIRRYIVDHQLNGDARGLTDHTDLLQARVIDSFGILELIAFLDEQFAFRMSADASFGDHFRTVSDIAQLVENASDRSTHT